MMQQMDTYMAWINRQLEDHPRRRTVTNLQKDMRDGIVFLQLVEIIGGLEQDICYDLPLSIFDMQVNINRVLEFLSNNNVRVHHIVPKEIIEGKLKSIMRLVLVLAAHFKPDTFNQSFPGTRRTKKLERTPSLVSILSNAAASLADASKNASGSAFKYKGGHNHSSIGLRSTGNSRRQDEGIATNTTMPNKSSSRSLFTTPNTSSTVPKSQRIKNKQEIQTMSDNSFSRIPPSPINRTTLLESPRSARRLETSMTSTPRTNVNTRTHSNSSMSSEVDITPKKTIAKYFNTESPVASTLSLYDCLQSDTQEINNHVLTNEMRNERNHFEELISHHEEMIDDLGITKTVLLELQNLLVNGQTAEEESGDYLPSNDDSFQEQLIMRTLMLEQKDEECSQMKSEMNELKEFNMQWSGEKVALQTRLAQQEKVILAFKCKLLQYEISNKSKYEEELVGGTEEHWKEMQKLHSQLAMRNDIIEKQKQEMNELNNEVQEKTELEASLQSKLETQESKVSILQKQIQELSERLHSFTFSEKVREEANVGMITGKLNEARFHRDTQRVLQEHKNMCTTLRNIRQKFKPEDPVQHAFESMEQSMTSFVDTLSMMEASMQNKESNNRIVNMTKTNLPLNMCSRSSSSSDSGCNNNNYLPSDPGERLKVIYYIGKSTTPVLKISDVGLGWFTLRDFKQAVNQPGKYRYFFKCVDSDFGYVREELLFDDDVVPGYDNKVVAWLERNVSDV